MTPIARPKAEPDTDLTCGERHLADPRSLAELQQRLIGSSTVGAVADVFKLLGDPTRVRLVDALTHGERCVCDLAALVGLSESAVSHQLRLLRAARLVRVRRAGRMAYYSLDDHHVVGLLHDTRKHVEEADDPAPSPAAALRESTVAAGSRGAVR
jgi:ArsR family transcriptional regulator, lead/cadmium/zinc/bismuth-responsive transcriptional repressor